MSKSKDTNRKKNKDSGNIYDRIFRENARTIFIPLIQSQLNIDITRYEPLEIKLVKTLEREVDFLYKIFNKKGKQSILHLEFQTKNNQEMLARMQEYHELIYRRHKLPIRHIVIYLGKRKSTMKNKLEPPFIFSGFDIINLTEINPEQLISTQIPEMVVMALLGNLKDNQVEKVLNDIVDKLKSLTDSEESMTKYINQLLILARIRNLEIIISQKLKNMPISYDVEKDGLYLQGIEKGEKRGIEKGEKRGIKKGEERGIKKGMDKGIAKSAWMLYKKGQSIEYIATTLELTVEQVNEAIKEWEAKS